MKGKVYLVGAGPGDPELLTVKALRLLQNADAVLYDDLVAPEILSLAPQTAQMHDVGKRCGKKKIHQEEINFLMIALADSGLQVVRLKSGDPLVFGRAGEEMESLRRAARPYMGVQYTPAMPGLRRPRRICGARNVATILILENREVVDQQAHCRPITGRRQQREFCTNPPRRVIGFRERRVSTTLSFASTSRVPNRRDQNGGSEVRCKTPCQQTVILDANPYGTTTTAFNPVVMRSQFATASGRRRGASSQRVPTRSVGTRNGFCPIPNP